MLPSKGFFCYIHEYSTLMTLDEIRNLRIEDFNYPLPEERIAKYPLADREQCKLLVYNHHALQGEFRFANVPELLPQGSMLVYNNTRVINARLRFRKPNQGAWIEIFCLEPHEPRDYAQIFATTAGCSWLCFIGNAKRWKSEPLELPLTINGKEVTLTARRGERHGNAFIVDFSWNSGDTFASILEAVGEIPIPPYLNRATEPSDSRDYQTVYSHIDGSVAAPTAGLHFTDRLLAECDRRGIRRRELTLHVGAGTFQPVKSDTIGDHEMHTEFISVPRSLLIDLIENNSSPVIAVGTTSVRTLESLYYIGLTLMRNPDADERELCIGQWLPYTIDAADEPDTKAALQAIVDYLDRHHADSYIGSTQIMIAPGFRFHVIDGMITNFHQPQSTLLLLVSAFVDGDWRSIYDYALAHDFRFLSYGDACLLLR